MHCLQAVARRKQWHHLSSRLADNFPADADCHSALRELLLVPEHAVCVAGMDVGPLVRQIGSLSALTIPVLQLHVYSEGF